MKSDCVKIGLFVLLLAGISSHASAADTGVYRDPNTAKTFLLLRVGSHYEKRYFASVEAFQGIYKGMDSTQIKEEKIDAPIGALIYSSDLLSARGDERRYFLVLNKKKYEVGSWTTHKALGLSESNAMHVSKPVLDAIENGDPLTISPLTPVYAHTTVDETSQMLNNDDIIVRTPVLSDPWARGNGISQKIPDFEGWLRGYAELNKQSNVLRFTVQHESDDVRFGAKSTGLVTLFDAGNRPIYSVRIGKLVSGGKSPGNAAIHSFHGVANIPPDISAACKSVSMSVQYTGRNTQVFSLPADTVIDAIKIVGAVVAVAGA